MTTRGQGDVPPAQLWEDAGKRYATGEKSAPHRDAESPEARPRRVAWEKVEEPPLKRGIRLVGQGVVWTLVVFLLITGLRQWFSSDKEQSATDEKPSTQSSETYPEARARAVVARWVHAYLSWNEETEAERAKALAVDMARGIDPQAGVSGAGEQKVLTVLPGDVEQGSQARARVHVTALIQSGKKEPYWTEIEVPVYASKGRVVVTGAPGFMGTPKNAPEVSPRPEKAVDDEVTKASKGSAEGFFKEWPKGNVSAITAPGAKISQMPSAFSFESLESWRVEKGRGDSRWATAKIRWSVGESTLSQEYKIEITKVRSSSGAQRWQVSDVKGGAL